jgi:molybdenum cofactor cytidylyltransferase
VSAPPRSSAGVRVAAVVLAAGTSSRWGGAVSKQLEPWRGEPLARRAARQAVESAAVDVVVVTGESAELVEQSLAGLAARPVRNPDFRGGQATSVRAGLAALAGNVDSDVDSDVDGALFVPCDQPLLSAGTLDLLIARFAELADRRGRAVVPSHRGRRGSPVLIGRDLFPLLAALEGDEGGRRVLATRPELVVEVELESADPLTDVDTLADLRALERRLREPETGT